MKNFNRNIKAISPIFRNPNTHRNRSHRRCRCLHFYKRNISDHDWRRNSTAQEKITVQASSYSGATTKIVTIYAQTTGGPTPVVSSIIIKDSTGNTVATVGIGTISPAVTGNALAKGTLYTIPGVALATARTSGTYTATLVTNAGGSFVSPSFTV